MLNKHGLIAAFAVVFTAVSLFFAGAAFAYTSKDLKTGDRYYQEKSYRLSATAFERLLSEKTENKTLAREVLFKYSDSILRGKDEAKREQAEKNLKELAESKDKDRWRAEAGGALAEHYFERDRWGHAQEIQTMLEDAREYWAGSDDVKLAREKFIALSFLLADHVTSWRGWYNPQIRAVSISGGKIKAPDGGSTMTQLYEEILKVAKSDEDKARAYYGLALSMRYSLGNNEDDVKKIVKAFEKVTEDFSRTEWADDAWNQLGQFHEGANRFPEAVKAYKGLLETFKRGESQFVDDARRRIEYITSPNLSMSVSNSFTPGSQIRFYLNWRNMDQARFTLYKLDLVAELGQRGANVSDMTHYQGLLRQLVERTARYRSLPVAADWTAKLKNDGKHMHHSNNQGMAAWRSKNPEKPDEKLGVLPAGAYLLMVTGANNQKAYDLVLVSDLALVSKLSRDTALFMVADAKTGKPAPHALVRYVYSWVNTNGSTQWEVAQGKTGADGLLAAELKYTRDQQPYYHNHNMFAAVSAAGGLQAFVQNNYYNNYNNNKGEWWTYAFTDRPAYRPNEQVGFKGVVRIPENGIFINPAGMQIRALIYDARGNKAYEKEHVLNEFGGFDDTLELDSKAVLGEYSLQIYNVKTGSHISTAPLFRLEEYKLPEFLVSVAPKLEEGKDPVFRLGDKLEMDIDAKYYFGGAVANAEVEYLVYQQGYTHSYEPPRPYPWYYREDHGAYRGRHHYRHMPYQDSGRLITQQKIKTDEKGKASFTIETDKDAGSDLQYRIEVRVVDQSRREIRATSNIKVTKTAFFAYAEPERSLYRPGDKVTVKIKTMTANDKPVSVEGTVSVAQQSWREPVLKEGRDEVVTPGGYAAQPVLKKFVKTDEKGEAKFTFEPMANGYYAVTFTGYDSGKEVTAQAHVFVSDEKATDIGYRYGGLQIITEKDTYNVGETARAMIVSDRPDTWVLFTQESDGLFGYELLYMKGPVRLVEIPVTQHFVPNVNLHAASLDQFQLKQVMEEVIVPPEGKFLNVKITSDKEVYQPQEDGVFDVTVTDQDGKPVTGEVALGLVDASVYYIQKDYAKDIREFFYGDKRLQSVAMQASFYQRSFVHLVHDAKNKVLVDKKDQYRRDKDASEPEEYGQLGGAATDSIRAKKSMMMDNRLARQEAAAPSAALAEGLSMADEESKEMDAPGRRANEKAVGGKGGMDDAGGEEERVRDDFRSTVIWLPGVKTDRNGHARIKATFPDSLTTWRMTARAVTKDTSVGNVTHEVRSNKQLMVRLQAPRFFTARDKVVLSALIDNISDQPLTLTPRIKTEGLTITGLYKDGQFVKGEIGPVTVPAGGQQRVDWVAYAAEEGEATVTVSAKSGNLSDAMKKSFAVIPHGIEKFIAQSSVLKGKGTDEAIGQRLVFKLPKERIKEATALQLTLSPSLAGNMLDALPYLAEYPYGCVEQTMSRFLPAVIVRSTMTQLGLSKRDVDNYINNVLTPRGDPAHPQRRNDATVAKLDAMVETGLARLYDFQHSNGGWGWWKESSTDRFMTAYVLWGLSLARDAGVNVRADVIERAKRYMQLELVKDEDAPDNLAWSLHALAAAGSKSTFEDKQRSRLWDMRDKLNPYSRALFAVSEQKRGDMQRAAVLGRNIVNGVMEDKENGTARWGESGIHYRWSEGGVEATAFVIKALSALDKDSKYLEPAVKWLSLNRRGGRWKNTRDTAIAILGLAEYLKTTQELSPDYIYQVKLNGKIVKEGRVTAQNVFTFDRIVNLPAGVLKDGDNTVEIAIKGKGALYTSGYLTYFTLEEPITKAGNEIFVDRQYEIKSVKETLMKGLKEDWKPLNDNDTVESGDRIRVSITMEAKNHYEYLISEDFKPAGLEAVSLTSGAGTAVKLDAEGRETGTTIPLYQEFRDQKAVFFIDKLKQGKYIIRYELRAEVPGQFHAMPNQSHAMYVPEIRANSDEMRVTVKD
ncbi:MAG: hypothetical protein EP349_08720 [Alphaproteobacteria bacterium]|nr:MAG: hypothetical protein EP349_08720 [Alphaproteobacteria bacterium]